MKECKENEHDFVPLSLVGTNIVKCTICGVEKPTEKTIEQKDENHEQKEKFMNNKEKKVKKLLVEMEFDETNDGLREELIKNKKVTMGFDDEHKVPIKLVRIIEEEKNFENMSKTTIGKNLHQLSKHIRQIADVLEELQKYKEDLEAFQEEDGTTFHEGNEEKNEVEQ